MKVVTAECPECHASHMLELDYYYACPYCCLETSELLGGKDKWGKAKFTQRHDDIKKFMIMTNSNYKKFFENEK